MIPKLEFENNSNKGEVLFFIMYRMHAQIGHPGKGNNIWKPVYKSEIKTNAPNIRNKASFLFNQFSILISDICGSEEDKEVKIEFFRSQKNGRHVNLGQVLFTVEELRGQEDHLFKLTKSTGVLTFEKLLIQKKNSFLEYIFGGCELNLAIAIDFTLSNGDPKERDSLHSLNLNNNQYYQALRSVGDILQFYDTDKQFPTFGFGARLPYHNLPGVSHCFALNGNIFDPECEGLDGVLEAYKSALRNVNLYGPTHFSSVLDVVN